MKKSTGSPCPLAARKPCRRVESNPLLQKNLSIPTQNNDRFVVNRGSVDFDVANYLLRKKESNEDDVADSPSKESYRRELAATLLKDDSSTSMNKWKILGFRKKPSRPVDDLQWLFSERVATDPSTEKSKPGRYIPQSADKTLDAPELLDDYYLNLLDWGANNILSIALANTVYLWNASTNSTYELLTVDDEVGPVTSVNWAADGRHIAVGLSNSLVQLWDSTSTRQLRSLKGHHARVGSLSWNGPILTTGGLDGLIINHDVRIRHSVVQTYRGHEQEVCGLKWSLSGQQLASGGNDNLLHIWDRNMSSSNGVTHYLHRMNEHCGAIKALSWCPFQSNLLASGGGSADRCIKFWNIHTGACLNSIETKSQVSALLWNKHHRELLSSHGHSENQLTLWKYPSMVKMTDLTGHTSRVLHMTQSPDGYTVASASADETLRLWQVFGTPDSTRRTNREPVEPFSKFLKHIR